MREATARGPSIDISEFERRLRGAKKSDETRSSDPLAELARLLHGDEAAQPVDPYGQVLAADRGERIDQPTKGAAPHPAPPQPGVAARHDDFLSAGLRGSLTPPFAEEDPSSYRQPAGQPAAADWSHPETTDYLDYGVEPDEQDQYRREEPPKGVFEKIRSALKPWHAVAGVAALGVVSVGWSFAHRGGVAGPREIATINAPEGPAKVQPNVVAEAAAPQRGAAILDRNQSAPVKKVVSREEQPVDPAAALRVVKLGDGPVDAPHEPAQGAFGPSFVSEPKKVRTVSVRADGTVIDRDAPPPAIARPAPTLASPPVRPASLGVNPGVDASPPTATPKSPAKPATTPRAAQPPRPKTVAEKPAAEDKPAAAEQTASAEAPAAEDHAAATGAFAVQFGAAGSEAEARQLMQQVASKYNGQLGGRRLGYRLAKVGEKSVYRVRVAGMSREQAVGVCEKVKAAGGNCFVAGN